MLLVWEKYTDYMAESAKLEGENFKVGVGNPRAPHPLYETLIIYMYMHIIKISTFTEISLSFPRPLHIHSQILNVYLDLYVRGELTLMHVCSFLSLQPTALLFYIAGPSYLSL